MKTTTQKTWVALKMKIRMGKVQTRATIRTATSLSGTILTRRLTQPRLKKKNGLKTQKEAQTKPLREVIKYQIVESPCQSTQVRQRSMKCDTQVLYGASGPTGVNEDGSCRANECTCALQGSVQMCMRSTLCSGDRHTTGIPTKRAEDTNLGSYSVQHFTSPLHDDRRATTPRQQGNLRLTHLQCSQFTWCRNQGSVISNHAVDSVTFAERVRNSKSRPPSIIHRSCERCTQTQ